jgi:hypothetical protein
VGNARQARDFAKFHRGLAETDAIDLRMLAGRVRREDLVRFLRPMAVA